MKSYIIKSAKNNRELEEIVNQAIEEGYAPQGGVQNDGSYFHQAMIKSVVTVPAEMMKEDAAELGLGDPNLATSSN